MDKTDVLPDGNVITVAPSVSVARKCWLSHTVPFHEGFALHHAILRWAGRDPAEDLMNIFTERVHSLTTAAERDLTEKLCCIGVDYDTELKSPAHIDKEKTQTYEPPDANIITVSAKSFRCVEGLSTTLPSRVSRSVTLIFARRPTRPQTKTSSLSVPNVLVAWECCSRQFHWQRTPRHLFIMKCDVDNCKNLYTSVVSSVGTTMFKGFFLEKGTDGIGSIHDEVKVGTSIRYGLEDLSCLPSAFSRY